MSMSLEISWNGWNFKLACFGYVEVFSISKTFQKMCKKHLKDKLSTLFTSKQRRCWRSLSCTVSRRHEKIWSGTLTNTCKHYWIEKVCKETKARKQQNPGKSLNCKGIKIKADFYVQMQHGVYFTDVCCILHFEEPCDISAISLPRAFSHYSVIRSGIQRRLCTRARFQSCLLSSLHSSNQRLRGLGGYLPRSTCALGPCQQHDANLWQL